jgi:hypothetical protein
MRNHRIDWRGTVVALAVGLGGPALAATEPVAGSTYVYRIVNGYSKEIRGQLHYRVERVDPAAYTVKVSPDTAAAGWERTEIHTREGNSLQRLIESHGNKVEYLFASAYPAYVFPLEPGRSWSTRVNATVPGKSGVRSVRVDGKVLGAERIRVPAGEFDTVKVRRLVYPGDPESFRTETRIVEFEWYAPALGRAVRTEVRSEYMDMSQCGGGERGGSCIFYGDWDVYELVKSGVQE